MSGGKFNNAYILITIFCALFLLNSSYTFGQKLDPKNTYEIAFYNVDELFDTIDSRLKVDNEYLPLSKKHWNLKKYDAKLLAISSTLGSLQQFNIPEIIGLCEVENRKILEQLTEFYGLHSKKWSIIHEDSPDYRGMDVALIYRPRKFKLISYETIRIDLSEYNCVTRDILYVRGIIPKTNDTLHIYVNDWPEDVDGIDNSQLRKKTAQTLMAHVNNIRFNDLDANIVIMGDFNENPNSEILAEIVDAKNPCSTCDIKSNDLYNTALTAFENGEGTCYENNHWQMYDQIIMTGNLFLKKDGFCTAQTQQNIFKTDYLLTADKNGVLVPSSTYKGDIFNERQPFSDHLPIYFQFGNVRTQKVASAN